MRLSNQGRKPQIHETAYIAPNAVISGDVCVGAHSRILFGAVLTAEGGPITVGEQTIVMENAVIRGVPGRATSIGNHCLIGPHAHLTGCTIENECFIATGACVFNGAVVRSQSGVRIGGIVHINTELPSHSLVPIGWIAVGRPAEMYPPGDHDRYTGELSRLDFGKTVFRVGKRSDGYLDMVAATTKYAEFLGRHSDDRVLER